MFETNKGSKKSFGAVQASKLCLLSCSILLSACSSNGALFGSSQNSNSPHDSSHKNRLPRVDTIPIEPAYPTVSNEPSATANSITSNSVVYDKKPIESSTIETNETLSNIKPNTSAKLDKPLLTGTPYGNNNLFICEDISPYVGSVVGNGECVDLLKACAGVSHTPQWREGESVWGKKIPTGTAIATFDQGVYPNRRGYHAAIYISQDEKGIYVWDQWAGKEVHTRLITATEIKDPGNTAQSYSIINRY